MDKAKAPLIIQKRLVWTGGCNNQRTSIELSPPDDYFSRLGNGHLPYLLV